jgi:aminomethyltransferase
MSTLKRTPLFEEHKKWGGNIVPFAGYEMPLVYTTMIEEHLTVRDTAGIFDVSHMGELEITGKDAVTFTDFLITNKVSDMKDGDIKYSPLCYEDGGEVDDLLAYRMGEKKMFLVVNASNVDKDFQHILDVHKKNPHFDVQIKNLSDLFGQVAFQGPLAEEILQTLTEEDLSQLKVFKFKEITIQGIKTITSRTGYTGEDGFEILALGDEIITVWNAILQVGKHKGVKPCGLGCRDTLRFEACLWLYGNDIDATTNPLEAGQNFAVKLDKDFVGRTAIQKVKDNGASRKLTAFFLEGKMIPRHGMDIKKEGTKIGYITSGSFCPKINKVAALGYIPAEMYKEGNSLIIEIRGKDQSAVIVPKPFYKGTAGRADRR